MVGGGWQTKFNVSPGPGLWSLVLRPFGPDLGPDLDLSLTIIVHSKRKNGIWKILNSKKIMLKGTCFVTNLKNTKMIKRLSKC